MKIFSDFLLGGNDTLSQSGVWVKRANHSISKSTPVVPDILIELKNGNDGAARRRWEEISDKVGWLTEIPLDEQFTAGAGFLKTRTAIENEKGFE